MKYLYMLIMCAALTGLTTLPVIWLGHVLAPWLCGLLALVLGAVGWLSAREIAYSEEQ